jgi:hypothetical protein
MIKVIVAAALAIGLYEWNVTKDRNELKKSRNDLQIDLGA